MASREEPQPLCGAGGASSGQFAKEAEKNNQETTAELVFYETEFQRKVGLPRKRA